MTNDALKIIKIKRWDFDDTDTIGGIYDEGKLFAITLERPWKGNQPDISCIPEGEYIAQLFHSAHFDFDVWKLLSVPNRENIEIHPANTVIEIKGCIAVGHNLNLLKTGDAIYDSRMAFEDLMGRTMGLTQIKVVIESCK